MKLIHKILLAIVLPIALASTLFIFFIHDVLYKEVENRFVANLERSTSDYANLLNTKFENIARLGNSNANYLEQMENEFGIKGINKQTITDLLSRTLNYDSLVYRTSVLFDSSFCYPLNIKSYQGSNINGKLEISPISVRVSDLNEMIRPEWKNASSSSQTFKGQWLPPYYIDILDSTRVISYTQPFYFNGTFSGIFVIDIQIKSVNKTLIKNEKSIEKNLDPDLYVINTCDSTIIYAEIPGLTGLHLFKSQNEPIYIDGSNNTVLDSVLLMKNGSGIVQDVFNQRLFFAFYAPISSTDWMVINILSNKKANAQVAKSINKTTILIIIFILLIILIIFFTSRLITNPISKLSNMTIEISKGNFDQHFELNRSDEIGILAKNFDEMNKKLLEREQNLKTANSQLLVLDDAKNEFLSLISHEIRTPLNGIVGSTHLLSDIINDPELSEFIEMLKESVDRLEKFSKIALEITQMQTIGKQRVKEVLSLNAVAEHVIENSKNKALEKMVTILTDFTTNDRVLGVEEYFRRAIEELVVNAIVYADSNTDIKIKTYYQNEKINICISDRGEVIPADKISEIMKPFGLGKKHYDKNIGLGLTYVQTFLDVHHGQIKITSGKEKTEITLSFSSVD